MSQQQQVPEPQDQHGQEEVSGQKYEARYYAQRSASSARGPKEEHPAAFSDMVPPYGYLEQDRATYTRPRAQQEQRPFQRGQRFNTQSQSRQVPPWARAQQNRGGRTLLKLLGLIVLGILLAKLLPILLVVLVSIVGVAMLVLLLPVLIILGIVAAFAIVAWIVLARLGVSFRHNGTYVRRERPWM
jgi:hypothetical protein